MGENLSSAIYSLALEDLDGMHVLWYLDRILKTSPGDIEYAVEMRQEIEDDLAHQSNDKSWE